MAYAGEKIIIGEVEDVILLPWKIRLPARIDTGAATSSLDAQELKVGGGFAEFKLSEKFGGRQLRLPIVDWRHIRSSEARERRPIVEIEFCIGPKRVRARVNLNDRSKVKYPLLLGRNILKENFVVDCTQERCSPPSCPEGPSQ
ncbi:MAG TPA: RimK/LysX family protein [Thermodesulfobacteriota bacterium]|nr:RimK/LysX family protein [Thermodesulfobacteriota bacterium]